MTAIRIEKLRGTRHAGTQTRVSCTVDGESFAARGYSAVYRILTQLYLAGHGGRRFEVWDDVSPTGGPGGLASSGRVRNFAKWDGRNWEFNQYTPADPEFTDSRAAAAAQAART